MSFKFIKAINSCPILRVKDLDKHLLYSRNLNLSAGFHFRCRSYCLNSRQFFKKNVIKSKMPNYRYMLNSSNRHLSTSYECLDNLLAKHSEIFLSISQSSSVVTLMESIQYIHEASGMSWWLTIAASTVGLRFLITFPLAIYQNYIISKVENLVVERIPLSKELKKETFIAMKKFGWTEQYSKIMYNRSARRIWRELIERDNCHPFKGTLPIFVQLPLWILISISYRNFATLMPHNDANAQLVFMELSCGGFGWLPNLIDVDHSYILPVVMGITNLLIIEVNRLSKVSVDSKVKKIVTNFFRFISIGLIPIAAYMPGCVVLYWASSSICGLAQNLILLHPKLRRVVGIPKSPSEITNPYNNLYNKILRKSPK